MRCHPLALSSGLLAASALWIQQIPGSESFRSVSTTSLRRKINARISETLTNLYSSNNNNNSNIDCINLQNSMKKHNNDDMVAAQEAEARKICPLLPPPEDITATFEAAMGWFWGPQREFDGEEGILETVVGYSGSTSRDTDTPANQNPTYQNVQDYAEAIRVTFDKDRWTYEQLLDYFFAAHMPADPRWAGTQYRSAIFCYTEDQKQLAEQACKKRGALGKYVAVEMASDFYRAEEYHQKYIEKQMEGVKFF